MGDDWQPGEDEETVKLLRPPAQNVVAGSQLETAATRTEGVAHTKLRAHAIGVERLDSLARDIPVDSASTQVTVPPCGLRVALATAQPYSNSRQWILRLCAAHGAAAERNGREAATRVAQGDATARHAIRQRAAMIPMVPMSRRGRAFALSPALLASLMRSGSIPIVVVRTTDRLSHTSRHVAINGKPSCSHGTAARGRTCWQEGVHRNLEFFFLGQISLPKTARSA